MKPNDTFVRFRASGDMKLGFTAFFMEYGTVLRVRCARRSGIAFLSFVQPNLHTKSMSMVQYQITPPVRI